MTLLNEIYFLFDINSQIVYCRQYFFRFNPLGILFLRRHAMTTWLINNVGLMLSGDVRQPKIAADSLVVKEGRIADIGSSLKAPDSAGVIDAGGGALCPGLIDSHCHVVLGDYTPRQQMQNFLDSMVHGGVTTGTRGEERERHMHNHFEQYKSLRGRYYQSPQTPARLYGAMPDPALRFLQRSVEHALANPRPGNAVGKKI